MMAAAAAQPKHWRFSVVVGMAILVMILEANLVMAEPHVPCCFVFGDSLVDSGNNNHLSSVAKANYMPYGIDFPNGPTGRFCNGKTAVDVISEILGFRDYIPPYSAARGDHTILKGLNYASAAAGIREETGWQLGGRISFTEQVENYKNTVSQVVNLLEGENDTAAYLSKCVHMVVIGSNDYLNNYFMPWFYTSSHLYSPEQFTDLLIQQYSQQLKVLYNYGAKKVALIGLGQIGCIPAILARNSSDGKTCVAHVNAACQMFNTRLKSMVDDLNINLSGAKFTYINAYGIFQDLLGKSESYGFKFTDAGCCGCGRNNGEITCLPLQTPCRNRNEYLFWDSFHPTEAANLIIGQRSYSAQYSSDAYPVDIHGLATL